MGRAKGVPYTLDERRLARAVEDHPIEYLQFEGTIPQGQYGGGTAMVWDIGTYEIIGGNYYKGRLHIHLDGKKLKGEWLIERDGSTGEGSWTLTKAGKAIKPVKDTSALTGRTMEEIAAAKGAVWQSNRLPDAKMAFVEPMQCKLGEALPEGPQWEYEIKLDGYRALAIRDDDRLRLLSRRNNALNDRFPDVAEALRALEPGTMVDGEVVVSTTTANHPSTGCRIIRVPSCTSRLTCWLGKARACSVSPWSTGAPPSGRRRLASVALCGWWNLHKPSLRL